MGRLDSSAFAGLANRRTVVRGIRAGRAARARRAVSDAIEDIVSVIGYVMVLLTTKGRDKERIDY